MSTQTTEALRRGDVAAALAAARRAATEQPESAEAEQPLQDMVEAIRQGQLHAFIPFDAQGHAVALG